MVTVSSPAALQTGAAETAEDQEIPGPVTVQSAFWPFTPAALHRTVEVWPARTRAGLAVIASVGVPDVHQPAPTVTRGQVAGLFDA